VVVVDVEVDFRDGFFVDARRVGFVEIMVVDVVMTMGFLVVSSAFGFIRL
jgi:hypothetical protein